MNSFVATCNRRFPRTLASNLIDARQVLVGETYNQKTAPKSLSPNFCRIRIPSENSQFYIRWNLLEINTISREITVWHTLSAIVNMGKRSPRKATEINLSFRPGYFPTLFDHDQSTATTITGRLSKDIRAIHNSPPHAGVKSFKSGLACQ